MAKGVIKRLISERGFGFIRLEDGTEVFFHRTGLADGQFDSLREGQGVEFEMEKDRRGPRAINVRISELDKQADQETPTASENQSPTPQGESRG